MKNLLMISHSSKSSGGGEEDFLRLLKEFSGMYRIHAVFPKGVKSELFRQYSHSFLEIPDYMFPFERFNLKKYLFYIYFSMAKIPMLLGYLGEIKGMIDLCYVNSSACLIEIFILNILRIPYVISVKEIINPGVVRKLIYKYIGKTSLKVILISGYLEGLFLGQCPGGRNILIHSSIEEEEYLEIAKGLQTVNEEVFTLINIGGIQQLKNQLLLLNALINYMGRRKIKAVFVGEIVEKKYYEKIACMAREIANDKVSVEFKGALCRADTIKEICASHCVVITSLSEGMSIVAAEALFLGKPLLAVEVGVIPEAVIDGYNGFVIRPPVCEMLKEKLELLSSDSELYEKLSGNCNESYYNVFSMKRFLDLHKSVVKEAISLKN